MLSQTKKIADQILEAISIMAKYFVQTEWPNLVPELQQTITNTQDPAIIRQCFEVFKKICKKYRFLFRSDNLYSEMNYMIGELSGLILTQASVRISTINLVQNCVNLVQQNMNNLPILQELFQIINSCLSLIESFLSQEELPDFYEEQLPLISSILAFILDITFPNPQSVPNHLVKCRSKSVKLIHLYQFKFNEYF